MFGKKTHSVLRKCVYVQVKLEQQRAEIRYVQLTAGDQAEKTLDWTAVENTAELVKKAGKSFPYIVHFIGFGVLARIAENVPNYKESLLVNGSEEDFYFSSYELKGTVGVSFVRKKLVENFVEELKFQKVFLWALHSGPVSLIALVGENGKLQTDYLIERSRGELTKLEKTGEERCAFSSDSTYPKAISLLTFGQNTAYGQGLAEEQFLRTQKEYGEYRLFVRLGIGILAFFLLTLMGNYFYVNHLNREAAQLESDIAGYGQNLAMIDRLQQEKQRKLLLVENTGLKTVHYLSYYLDEIGASVPSAVQLSVLETFPLKEPLKPKRKVELNNTQIVVQGFSGSSKVLDDWMELLERKQWVKSVELIHYVRLSDQKATFHLLIKMNE